MAGEAIPVSQGSGLSVSPSGVATQRPVNPVVATKIEKTNKAATEATQDFSLGEVAGAMEQSAANDNQVVEPEEVSESKDGEVESVPMEEEQPLESSSEEEGGAEPRSGESSSGWEQ